MIIPEDSLLIKTDFENVIKSIKKFTNELIIQNEQIEISQNLLLNYYNLITNNITDFNTIIYILHLLSREINKSNSVEQKTLLSLLPEFFVPFFNTDITLTYPYLNRILTTIQSNIQSSQSPVFIGEIFKKIIFYLFFNEEEQIKEPINKKNFEICQGFCLYNMKLNNENNQIVGTICLNILLNEIDYSFLNQNNFVYYIWENISNFLEQPNFLPKNYLLKYIYDFISKFKTIFKPFVEIVIYKILEFIDDKDGNIRKSSLNILGLLISFYPTEIEKIKNLIMKLLLVLNKDKDENIRIKSIYLYNKIKNQYNSEQQLKKSKSKKSNLYFYDMGYNIWFNQKNPKLNITGNDSTIGHRRLLSRNPTMTNLKLNNNLKRYKAVYTEPGNPKSEYGEVSGVYSKKSTIKLDVKNDIKNIKINKNDNNDEKMKFKELLNLVKIQKNNKINQDFSDIRKILTRNNSGLSLIKRIKSRKKI